MSEGIIKVLDDLGNRFGIAIDWTSENVMPYLQDLFTRFINYKIGTTIMWIVICVIVLIASVIILVKSLKGFKEEGAKNFCDMNEFRQIYCAIGAFVALVTCLITPIALVENTDDLIKELTIPEVVIYDYVKNQI